MSATADLLPQHQELIDDSGISPEVAAARGYESEDALDALAGYGFTEAQRRVPALVIPVHTVDSTVAFRQIRPDEPRKRDGKVIKYETPIGQHMVIDVPPGARENLGNPAVELHITEGIRKADAAVSAGYCCIDILGVDAWRGKNDLGGLTALADWESIALNNRRVFLDFDSDVTKPAVQRALQRLKRFLEGRKAVVYTVRIPPGPDGKKVGLDDFLADGGDLDQLVDEAITAGEFEPAKKLAPEAGTDMWAAEQFGADNRDRFAWVPELRKWLTYGTTLTPHGLGGVWTEDVGVVEVLLHVKLMVTAWGQHAGEYNDEGRKKLWSTAIKYSDVHKQQNIVESSKTTLKVPLARFDADPWVLNTKNGVLDLKTFAMRSSAPEDYCRGQVDAEYIPGVTDPIFERHLRENLPDEQTRQTEQELNGYALAGDKYLEILEARYGPKRSGKTTHTDLQRRTMGSYAVDVPAGIFMVSRRDNDGEANKPTTARIVGKRLVTSGEASSHHRLDVGTVKGMTGRDPMHATPKYGHPIEFYPQFIWVLHGNHRPQVPHDEAAMHARIVEVPFKVGREEDAVDSDVKTHLLSSPAARNAFLAWAVEGLKRLTGREGRKLYRADEVRASTEAFWRAQDVLGPFLDRLVFEPEAFTASAVMKMEFDGWREDTGIKGVEMADLFKALNGKGCQNDTRSVGGRNQRGWFGVGLKSHGRTPSHATSQDFSHERDIEKVPVTGVRPRAACEVPTRVPRAPRR